MDPTEVLTRAAEGPDVVLRYAAYEDGLVDVFLPPSLGRPASTLPLIVLVHGGFWRQQTDRRHLRPLANDLCGRGFVVAVPEYRRGDGGWPATGSDVESALLATPAMLDDVAPGWVDPAAPLVLAGHSAGGHLALWAGLRAGRARVRRVVALAPVADLRYAARTGLGHGAAQALLGGEPDDVPEQYADADPLRLLPGEVPVTVIQGTADEEVPVSMNRRVAADHPTVTYVEIDGVDHFALIDPLSAAFQRSVVPALG